MKLSWAQLLLGILVVLSGILFSAVVEPGYWQYQGMDGGLRVMTFGNPGSNTGMHIWILCYAAVGAASVAASAASLLLKTKRAKVGLALAEAIVGVMVVSSLVAYILWLEPNWASYTRLSDTGNQVLMSHDPGWVATQLTWKGASVLVGLAMVGVGVLETVHLRNK